MVRDPELDLVNLTDIADRLGVAYITVRKWYDNGRPAGILPPPDVVAADRYPFWEWDRIVEWCFETGREKYLPTAGSSRRS